MISYIRGSVKFKGENFLVVENNGIGYQVFVPEELLLKTNTGDEAEFFTYQHVREDALQLFGFRTIEELKLFEQLISVSGVGPKTALAVFAVAAVEDIISAIASSNASILKKVSGIGTKIAERIVLELKNKVAALSNLADIKDANELDADADAVEALVTLGFSANQSREALKRVDPSKKDVRERVRQALKILKQ